eukprot:TRINITY_DN5549_c0_g2_i1.p1 TRINITY_DN5549_c0_g2~~TRINITY_DN5549_c0_g2_i1.p1  ORF type:complete len:276 (-),score=36.39 TRINITY_DN5549_c0_g2_i1:485-1249(-)
MTTFRQLLAYHDPELAAHLHRHNFLPSLYAIPWFLTLFAHIFELDKIFWVWDTLLLYPPALMEFFALGVMNQLREKLLPLDFNSCILMFSNMPEIDIQGCMAYALKTFKSTPISLYTSKVIDSNPSRWWESEATTKNVENEIAPRLSLQDLFSFGSPPVIVDVRTSEAYTRSHYPRSLLLPPTADSVYALEKYRNRPIVVISGHDDKAATFANKLVLANLPFVSTLNGGIDCIQSDASAVLEFNTPAPNGKKKG